MAREPDTQIFTPFQRNVAWLVSVFITLAGVGLFGYSIVEGKTLPSLAYPVLGLMMGVLPASVGNELLKRWAGGAK